MFIERKNNRNKTNHEIWRENKFYHEIIGDLQSRISYKLLENCVALMALCLTLSKWVCFSDTKCVILDTFPIHIALAHFETVKISNSWSLGHIINKSI